MKQTIVTLDMEGVLVPEIWIAVADRCGIEELRLTTRDIPDYSELMRGRLRILEENQLSLADIQEVIGELSPLPGAKEFLDELRSLCNVVILSDTFTQFASPLMRQLDWPTLFCNSLEVKDGKVVDFHLRQPDQKRQAVIALKSVYYRIIAAGDSFNDTTMLQEADLGFLFKSPPSIQEQFPQFRALDEFDDLLTAIRENL